MRIIRYFITIVLVIGYVAAAPESKLTLLTILEKKLNIFSPYLQIGESRALIEDIVAGMLECARGLLEEGVPEIGFPSLKNLTIPSMNFNLNELSDDFL